MKTPLQVIVFDLDGTLIDSRADLACAVNAALADLGLPTKEEEEISTFVGDGARKLLERSTDSSDDELVSRGLRLFIDRYREMCTQKTTLYPGVKQCLEILAWDYRLCLLTNKPEEHSRIILQHFDLSKYFQMIIGGDSLETKKPNPDCLKHICDEQGITPDACLMVGDHHTDLKTAAGLGMDSVFCNFGFGHTGELSPTGEISYFGELLDWIRENRSQTCACQRC